VIERLIPGVPGLQAERTDLSWARTALTVMIYGGLLLLRHDLHGPNALQLAGGTAAFALTLFALMVSRRRQALLAQRPLPVPLATPSAILLLSGGTALIGAITLAVIITV
jgi:uncharacterized membrane protein YidH (DUF202 family)